jgi:hypothetical protein
VDGRSNGWRLNYLPFAAAGAAGAAGVTDAAGAADSDAADFFRGFAGRLLPNDPLNIFPFLVFLSPLPMIVFLRASALYKIIKVTKKPRYLHLHARQRSFTLRRSRQTNYTKAAGGSLFDRTDLYQTAGGGSSVGQTIISQTVPYLL